MSAHTNSVNNSTSSSVASSPDEELGFNHEAESVNNQGNTITQSLNVPTQVVYVNDFTEDKEKEKPARNLPVQNPIRRQAGSEGRRGYRSLRASAIPPRRGPTSALRIRAENDPSVIAERQIKTQNTKKTLNGNTASSSRKQATTPPPLYPNLKRREYIYYAPSKFVE